MEVGSWNGGQFSSFRFPDIIFCHGSLVREMEDSFLFHFPDVSFSTEVQFEFLAAG